MVSDQQLLGDYCERQDQDAFAEIVRRHSTSVFGAAVRVLDDVALAEDASQQTFSLLASRAQQLRSRKDVGGWLYLSAVNHARNARRSAARERDRLSSYEPDKAVRMPDEEVALREARGEIDEAIHKFLQGAFVYDGSRRLRSPEGPAHCLPGWET